MLHCSSGQVSPSNSPPPLLSSNETLALPLPQLEEKIVSMAKSEQQQMMAAHIELLNKSGGRGETLSGEVVNHLQPLFKIASYCRHRNQMGGTCHTVWY